MTLEKYTWEGDFLEKQNPSLVCAGRIFSFLRSGIFHYLKFILPAFLCFLSNPGVFIR